MERVHSKVKTLNEEALEAQLEAGRQRDERKRDYFLKKHNLSELTQKMNNMHAKFETSLKQHNVTYDEACRGLMPQELFPEAEKYFKQFNFTMGAIEYAKAKAHESGEMANFEKDFEADTEQTERREIDTKKYTEASEFYQKTGSKKAFADMIKTREDLHGGGIEDIIKRARQAQSEETRAIEDGMRDKYSKETAEIDAAEQETSERLLKSKSPHERSHGEIIRKNLLRKQANAVDLEFQEQETAQKRSNE